MGPSATPERNFVGLWGTKKIRIIFFGLAAANAAAAKRKTIDKGTPEDSAGAGAAEESGAKE